MTRRWGWRGHRLLAVMKRCLRAFIEHLIADEVCGRSFGYWLR
jgi:hypothetical protein